MQLRALNDYDVSAERGFLCKHDAAAIHLPDCVTAARELALQLPARIVAGRARSDIEAMPRISTNTLAAITDDTVLRTALVHYAFLGQAYVWSEPSAPDALPESVAQPLWALSERLGQPAILTYSQYVLDNWALIDKQGPVDLSNVYMPQPFLSGQDEAWFVLIHVGIEAAAGGMLARLPDAIDAANNNDLARLTMQLEKMLDVWADMQTIFDRMPERCDPYVYFQRVRPWIHGWKDNPRLPDGIIYRGVAETGGKPQAFRGQTGSQSSIVPVMDAFWALGMDTTHCAAFWMSCMHTVCPSTVNTLKMFAQRARSGTS